MEQITMSKKEFLDKVQNCVDDTTLKIKVDGAKSCLYGNVCVYSEGFDRMYEPGELVDRLSIELKREISKVTRNSAGLFELAICENEDKVKKLRDRARYEVCTDEEYNSLIAYAANVLCITRNDADILLGCGYGTY